MSMLHKTAYQVMVEWKREKLTEFDKSGRRQRLLEQEQRDAKAYARFRRLILTPLP